MKISDLILFDALLYDKRLDDALKHLSLLHKEKRYHILLLNRLYKER